MHVWWHSEFVRIIVILQKLHFVSFARSQVTTVPTNSPWYKTYIWRSFCKIKLVHHNFNKPTVISTTHLQMNFAPNNKRRKTCPSHLYEIKTSSTTIILLCGQTSYQPKIKVMVLFWQMGNYARLIKTR